MRRLRTKLLIWTILLVTVVVTHNDGLSISKRAASKPTSSTSVSPSSVTEASVTVSSTTQSSGSRFKPKPATRRKTTTTSTTTVAPASTTTKKSTASKKKQEKDKTSTTTLSPVDIMNRLYQMHGLASHGVSVSHAASYVPPSSSSSKKKEQQASSSMDDIYRLHAMAMAQASSHSSSKKKPETSSSSGSASDRVKDSSYTKQSSYSQNHHLDHIYAQHSSLPSSMHHIMAQHSQSRPQKTSSSSSSSSSSSNAVKDSLSSSSLSSIMQPLLKQLTPVGAGLGVVLAPLLLFNGFLTFFSNMSRFLNNFAQTILPNRRPPNQNPQNFFQNLGPEHLQRQPRDWLINAENLKDIHEFAELIFKALKETEASRDM